MLEKPLIDLSSIGVKKEITSDASAAYTNSAAAVICKRPGKLMHVIELFKDNDTVHYASDGSWSLHHLFSQIIDSFTGADLFITTYAITEISARVICNALADGRLQSVAILGDKRIKDRYPAVHQMLAYNARFIGTNVHAKIMCIQDKNSKIIHFGSSNWTENPRLEIGVLSRDEFLFNFYLNIVKSKLDAENIF